MTFQQHLIMASLIEREARIDPDRPLIASVMFNRLKTNMPLGIDASIRYALNEWKRHRYLFTARTPCHVGAWLSATQA